MGRSRNRIARALVALSTLAVGCSQAPRGPAPKYLQTSSGVDSVEATIWAGRDSRGQSRTWTFGHGGGGRFIWRQQGARVTWSDNSGDEQYEGTIAGDQLNGTASKPHLLTLEEWDRGVRTGPNSRDTWTFSLRRRGQAQPEPEPPPPICVATASIEGTVWVGSEGVFEFQEGSVLYYTLAATGFTAWVPNGWEQQECGRVTWHTAPLALQYEYRGIIAGNQLNGTVRIPGMTPRSISLRRGQRRQ